MQDFCREALKSGKVKDLNVLLGDISLADFSRLTDIPHHQLIGKKGNWSTLREKDKELLRKAFDLTREQLDEIMKQSRLQ